MSTHRVKILSADFVTTAVSAEGYPKQHGFEVAFVGRSNVGKSSMINALCQRRKLVRVSNEPGRTRTLNFFQVALEDEKGAHREVRFCDLPGYGFAKASKSERRQWHEMIEIYLHNRESLCAVVNIIDAEIGPTIDDLQMFPWLIEAGRRVIIAATKIDRIPKHRRIPRVKEMEQIIGFANEWVIGTSATNKIGIEDLWHKIFEACDLAAYSNQHIEKNSLSRR